MSTQQVTSSEQLNDRSGGWIPSVDTFTFISSDSPSYLVSVGYNATGTYAVGMKFQLTHQSSIKNFFVTQVTLTGTSTYLNLYGGTDYTLNVTGSITNPKFSGQKSPYGFPLDPDKWTVSLSNSSNLSQASPVNGTFYNLGNLSMDIPIGAWNVVWKAFLETTATLTALRLVGLQGTISTSNSSSTDTGFEWQMSISLSTGSITFRVVSSPIPKVLNLVSKTTYYLNAFVNVPTDNATNVAFRGDFKPSVILAVCAYL